MLASFFAWWRRRRSTMTVVRGGDGSVVALATHRAITDEEVKRLRQAWVAAGNIQGDTFSF